MVTSPRALVCVLVALSVAWAGCVAGEAESAGVETPGPAPIDPNKPESIQAPPGTISGVVVDPELVPIEGVDIVITPGDILLQTNAAGAFVTEALDAGDYTVNASKRGYSSREAKATVVDDKPTKVTLALDPMASDVPYHETLIRTMHLYCAVSIHVFVDGVTNSQSSVPCGGLVDIVLQTATGGNNSNTLDEWTFDFAIDKTGFSSLVMEMTWPQQQFGTNGLMQLTEFATAQATETGGVTIGKTVYGDAMAQPYHAVIHAGNSYWVSGGENVTFYPEANETVQYQMLVAGYYGNTSVPAGESAVFIEYRPTAYLTLFYNRQANGDFSILPDE